MAAADERSVLGRFDGQRFTYNRVTSTFFRRDRKFFARTDGPDGRLTDFEIKFTFGLFPLQQYLIELPGGRLQALGIAWDARPASSGGQRWFHLYPAERIAAGDPLHWTGLRQNWNFMCADCHSTDVRKGYDPSARVFHTTWSELSVGCEACHGPGSAHVQWAHGGHGPGEAPAPAGRYLTAPLDDRRHGRWVIDPTTATPSRSEPRRSDAEIDACARCHARRSQMTDAARAGERFEDAFRPSLLEPALFHPDGQPRDEVYNYASFLQSRMYAKGVTCGDCHDPHSGSLRQPANAVCTQCHLAAKYDAPAHHFHKAGTPAAACATCHMPMQTYMIVDPRHDHSFRVPRPDRSTALGVPDVCTGACHRDRAPAWATAELLRRNGHAPAGYQQFAETFAAADRHTAGSARGLLTLAADTTQPAIVRASALERVADSPVALEASAITPALRDPNPMVRRAALTTLRNADAAIRLEYAPALLADPIRTVRAQAVLCLADLADGRLLPADRAVFERAFDEYVAEQRFNADRPEAQTNLGTVLAARGRSEAAAAAYREAITLDRTFVPAYVNLSDIHRLHGDESGAEQVLREAIAANPAAADAHHALGLSLVRQRRTKDALVELADAARRAPAVARYTYVWAVAMHDNGATRQALAALEASLTRNPLDRDTLYAAALYSGEAGRTRDAREYARRLLAIDPNDAEARQLAGRLQ